MCLFCQGVGLIV
ncbi:hypothetical protein F383_35508 [Gossypium arboreum]|uniref:Uncharacterized protein n=1 Tax=Gossypium arboreum TaxID=29729 RepID=A0A0B0PW39_GOSAR|nr:hypothetical protein F383_35508 [Gossypium arboreum]